MHAISKKIDAFLPHGFLMQGHGRTSTALALCRSSSVQASGSSSAAGFLHASRRIFSLPQIGHNIAGRDAVVDLTCRCWHPLSMLAKPDPGEERISAWFRGRGPAPNFSACAELTAKLENILEDACFWPGCKAGRPG